MSRSGGGRSRRRLINHNLTGFLIGAVGDILPKGGFRLSGGGGSGRRLGGKNRAATYFFVYSLSERDARLRARAPRKCGVAFNAA